MFRTREEMAAKLAELRERSGLTQREVADALDVDASAVSKIEAGVRGLAAEELAVLADLYEVHVDAILREDDLAFSFRSQLDDDTTRRVVSAFDKVYDDFFALRAAAD